MPICMSFACPSQFGAQSFMSPLSLLPSLFLGPWRRAVWSLNVGPSSGGQARSGQEGGWSGQLGPRLLCSG